MRRRVLLLLAGIALATLVFGCTGISPLTGGSVPIGDIDGWVYRAARGANPAANVPVQLLNENDAVLQTATTDAAGHFRFREVPTGPLRVCAQLATSQAELAVDYREKEAVQMRLVLTEATQQFTQLLLTPTAPVAHVGEQLTFVAQGITAGGTFVPVPASWCLKGDIGTISADGLFTATKLGTGRLIAQTPGLPPAITPINILPPGVNP